MNLSKSSSSVCSWSSSLSNWSDQQQQQQQQQQQFQLTHNYIQAFEQPAQQCLQPIPSAPQTQMKRPITGTANFCSHLKTLGWYKPHSRDPFSSSSVSALTTQVGNNNVTPTAVYSRKVFIGGLPPDIDENEIVLHFRRYGQLVVDWPHKSESKSQFPPKGYAFLIFDKEVSVQELISNCIVDKDKQLIFLSSSSIKDKPVQIRSWCLNDSDFILDNSHPIDPRRTVFVGGVPRPLKAVELAMIMNRLYGGVCYAGIDIDPELKYPKGAGRVSFTNHSSYVAAISARFAHLQFGDIDKKAEVKPYVLDDQICDICKGFNSKGKFAPFFCANVTCLQYYCESCWASVHSGQGREYHKPLLKEGADRPRIVPFKWC